MQHATLSLKLRTLTSSGTMGNTKQDKGEQKVIVFWQIPPSKNKSMACIESVHQNI